MNYEIWAKAVPGEITGDSLWKMEAYQASQHQGMEENPLPPEALSRLLQDVPMP